MSDSTSKVNKLYEQNQENSPASKDDFEVDQVELRVPIHVEDTSLQLTTSTIETDIFIELTSRIDESEISVLSTVPTEGSNISVPSTGSTVNIAQLIDSIITTNSSLELSSRIDETNISVQPSMKDTDISVGASTLLYVADISVQPTTSINVADNPVIPATRFNEAGTSAQETTTINEAGMSTQFTTPMNDASVEAASSMITAAISVQPTASMSEAVQPTYSYNVEDLTARINKVKISVQSTVPMTVAIIPGQSSAAMHDADSFIEAIQEADPNAQPTDQINEADTAVQPTDQIKEADPNAQPTEQINEADPNAQPTDQINEADLSSTEEYREAFRIFQWIEVKLDLLKTVQGNDEKADNNDQNELRNLSLNEKSTLLERMLEEISQQMTSTNIAEKDDYFSREVTRMLNMLQETTQEVLNSFKVSQRPNFKVLSVLMKHLTANIGSEVNLHDVLTFIDGPRVMKHFMDVQIAREPRYLKMSVVKSNLELGVRRAQYLKGKSRGYKSKAEWVEWLSRNVDVRSANQQLKILAKESEVALLNYRAAVKFVLRKARVFMTLKTDNEDVLSYFLNTEIHNMYKKEI